MISGKAVLYHNWAKAGRRMALTLFDLFGTRRTVRTNLHFPMDIHSIHPLRQPEYVNRCGSNRGGCSHLCLPNRSSYTCACPPGLQLITPNGRTCTSQPGELLIFAQKSELRLFPLNVSGEVDHVLPLTGVRSAVALDWDGASKCLLSSKLNPRTDSISSATTL